MHKKTAHIASISINQTVGDWKVTEIRMQKLFVVPKTEDSIDVIP